MSLDHVVSGSIGALAALLLRAAFDAWRARPQLVVSVPAAKTWAYYVMRDSSGAAPKYSDGSEAGSWLYVEFPIFIHNRSDIDDSVVGLTLRLSPTLQPAHAKLSTSEGLDFFSQGVDRHHLEVILVRFHFDHDHYGSASEWDFVQSAKQLDLQLTIETGRGKTLRVAVSATRYFAAANGAPVVSPYSAG